MIEEFRLKKKCIELSEDGFDVEIHLLYFEGSQGGNLMFSVTRDVWKSWKLGDKLTLDKVLQFSTIAS